MSVMNYKKLMAFVATLTVMVLSILVTGCGSKNIELHDVSVNGHASTLTISLPFDFRNPMTPKTFPNGTTICTSADHNSDFEITVMSVHYDRAKYKEFTASEFKPDLNKFSEDLLKTYKSKRQSTGGQLENATVAGEPAKVAVLDGTSNDIKIKTRFISFFKGDEHWCITISYKADDDDYEKAADKIVESIHF